MAAEEGRDLADSIGDRFNSRHCRLCLGLAQSTQGDLTGAVAQFRIIAAEAEAAHDGLLEATGHAHQCIVLARQGDTVAARAAADASLQSASEIGGVFESIGYFALSVAAVAAGDVETAREACAEAWARGSGVPGYAAHLRPYSALAELAGGDVLAARRLADEAVATATGWYVRMNCAGNARSGGDCAG